jgi:hypothetical protein
MGSSNLKWGRNPDGQNSDQNEITFITYFCMLNRLKEQSDDKGFVLEEISEIK